MKTIKALNIAFHTAITIYKLIMHDAMISLDINERNIRYNIPVSHTLGYWENVDLGI